MQQGNVISSVCVCLCVDIAAFSFSCVRATLNELTKGMNDEWAIKGICRLCPGEIDYYHYYY